MKKAHFSFSPLPSDPFPLHPLLFGDRNKTHAPPTSTSHSGRSERTGREEIVEEEGESTGEVLASIN